MEGNQTKCLCELPLEDCLSPHSFLEFVLERMWWGQRPGFCPLALSLGSDCMRCWLLWPLSWGCVLFRSVLMLLVAPALGPASALLLFSLCPHAPESSELGPLPSQTLRHTQPWVWAWPGSHGEVGAQPQAVCDPQGLCEHPDGPGSAESRPCPKHTCNGYLQMGDTLLSAQALFQPPLHTCRSLALSSWRQLVVHSSVQFFHLCS